MKPLTGQKLVEIIGDLDIPVYIQTESGAMCVLAKSAIYSDHMAEEDSEDYSDAILITVEDLEECNQLN